MGTTILVLKQKNILPHLMYFVRYVIRFFREPAHSHTDKKILGSFIPTINAISRHNSRSISLSLSSAFCLSDPQNIVFLLSKRKKKIFEPNLRKNSEKIKSLSLSFIIHC